MKVLTGNPLFPTSQLLAKVHPESQPHLESLHIFSSLSRSLPQVQGAISQSLGPALRHGYLGPRFFPIWPRVRLFELNTFSKRGGNFDPKFFAFPPKVTKDVNYTQVVFAAPGERRNDSVLDYENIKEATDYVNVNRKSHKPNIWTFVNPAVSEPVEYTQVVMWILGFLMGCSSLWTLALILQGNYCFVLFCFFKTRHRRKNKPVSQQETFRSGRNSRLSVKTSEHISRESDEVFLRKKFLKDFNQL